MVGSHHVVDDACAPGLDIDRYHDGLWRRWWTRRSAPAIAAATRSNERYHAMLRELGVGVSDKPSPALRPHPLG